LNLFFVLDTGLSAHLVAFGPQLIDLGIPFPDLRFHHREVFIFLAHGRLLWVDRTQRPCRVMRCAPSWEQETADGFPKLRGAEPKAGPLRLLVYATGIGLQRGRMIRCRALDASYGCQRFPTNEPAGDTFPLSRNDPNLLFGGNVQGGGSCKP